MTVTYNCCMVVYLPVRVCTPSLLYSARGQSGFCACALGLTGRLYIACVRIVCVLLMCIFIFPLAVFLWLISILR
jgi:hypothetical protein